MPHSEFNIRIQHPIKIGTHRPKPFVQQRHLRVNGKITPGDGLKPNLFKDVGEKLARRGNRGCTRNVGSGWGNDLGKWVVEIDIKIAVDVEPIESRGIAASLEPVPDTEAQYRPPIERIDRAVLGE